MRAIQSLPSSIAALCLLAFPLLCLSQGTSSASASSISKICTVTFDKDARRPARPEDAAKECISRAAQELKVNPDTALFLVATADSKKDSQSMHGMERTEQDMTGEDLRYADVAAYRAINTKAYMVRWLHVNPKMVIPFTTYEDGRWLEIYSAKKGTDFRALYSKKTAPIIERPCTVGPCAGRYEEFLVAQQRSRIP